MKISLLVRQISAIRHTQSSKNDSSSFFTRSLYFLFFTLTILFTSGSYAQSATRQDSSYRKTIHDRSDKIVKTLDINDQAKYAIVLDLVMNQYFDLNEVHDGHKKAIADLKKQNLPKEEMDKIIEAQEEKKSSRLLQLHNAFIGHLKENLSDSQVDKIKDGMTYNVFHVTYTSYQDMIPRLTTPQKEKIYTWLLEAREKAMDEGSSEDKHKVFGKYKGRINNYLSSEGYNLKDEENQWRERLKARRNEQKK